MLNEPGSCLLELVSTSQQRASNTLELLLAPDLTPKNMLQARCMRKWSEEIKQLASVAQTQPHAAYCAYTHGLSSRWFFLSQTIPDISDLLLPLEKANQQYLIPALTGRPPCFREERDLLALPVCLGGMGIINPICSSHVFEASVRLTSPLVAIIATQDQDQSVDIGNQGFNTADQP